MANIPFTEFEFAAEGSPTARTMPDRLADVFNVKDWGAVGDNVTDDTAEIQAAMTALMSAGGGTLFFPIGDYRTSAPITFNDDNDFGLHVLGSGNGTAISPLGAGFAGYIFDRKLATPNNTYGPRVFENMRIENDHASGGAIRLGSTIGGAVRCCIIGGGQCGFTAEDEPGASSDSIVIDNCLFQSGVSSGTPKALIFGGKGLIISGSDFTACDEAITLYGSGVAIYGTRMESLNVGLVLGVDSAGTNRGLHGLSISGMPMEGQLTFIDFRGTVTGFAIGANTFTGHDATNAGFADLVTNSEYGIRIRADTAIAGEFFACNSGSFFDIASIYIEDYTVRANVVFTACQSSVGGGAGVPWRLPTSPCGFKFFECNVDSGSNAPDGTRYTFANLPGSGIRLEGDEYDISDCSTATIGNTASAGGANRVRVRWDGTNWIVI